MIEAFGKFLLLEKLAAGGMAEVYLAKSQGTGGINKFVAIKRILPQFSDNVEFIDMFKEEAKIAVNLNHGNVVSIYDFGVEKNAFFLVMEFVEGQNLRQVLNHMKKESRDLSMDQIIYLVKEVAAGLDHAHRCLDANTGRPLNITHRDMSPQNIMISFEGEVKVVDFGIAKAENQIENTRVGTIKGKFGYMSPEQADGQVVDLRTDIFSMGIVLWELLAKDRLFVAQTEAATLRRVRECQIPSLRKINPSIPPELERICNKALAKDKSLRYQTSAAFHKDLNRFLNLQYPEFSAQEFSKVIKSIYNKMYVENRRKFSEFAKINFKEEGTFVTETDASESTQTDTESKAQNSQALVSPKTNVKITSPNSSKDENLEIDLKSKRIDLGELKFAEQATQSPRQLAIKKELTRASGTITRAPTHSGPNHGGFTHTGMTSTKNSKKPSSPSAGLVAVLFVGLGLAAVYFMKEDDTVMVGVRDQPSTSPTRPSTDKKITALEPSSNRPLVPFSVYSQPTGAIVYLDGQNKGLTPYRGWLESDRSVKVTIVKDGYLPYDKGEMKPAASEGLTIRATLQPEPPMGFVAIEVVNGGAEPVVTVNGQRLSEKPPIQRYQIPAGIPVKVRAYNPISQLYAEETMTVGVGQRKSIRLILGRTGNAQ